MSVDGPLHAYTYLGVVEVGSLREGRVVYPCP